MKQRIPVNDFQDAFTAAGCGDQFSYDRLGALFEYLEDLENSNRIYSLKGDK